MSEWDGWIGRQIEGEDRIDGGTLARWLATFDRAPPPDDGAPQGFHWCLVLPDAPTAALGDDGHPRREVGDASGLLPPIALARRMWAGSSIYFHAPLRAGQLVTRSSQIAAISEKSGASGRLAFVDIDHRSFADGLLAVEERQTLVFRAPPPRDASPQQPNSGNAGFDAAAWDVYRSLQPSEPLLMRYSALTFNAHRIHYDLPYATGVEGYRGLVVHGPLTATLLLDLLQRRWGDDCAERFEFRARSPAMCGETLHLALRARGAHVDLGAYADDGRTIMSATATLDRRAIGG